MLTVKGILRMGVGRYGLGLRRSMLEMLSDIYYRIYFFYETASGVHQLQAKLQCRWMQNATRDHFGGVVRLVSSKTTIYGERIGSHKLCANLVSVIFLPFSDNWSFTAVIVVFVFFKRRGTRLVVTTDKSSAVYPKPES